MGLTIVAFCLMFLIVASGGLMLFYRQEMHKRISAAIAPAEKPPKALNAVQQTSHSLGVVVEKLERVVPKSQAEVSVMQRRLIRAGYRNESAINILYGAKVLAPAILCATLLVSGLASSSPFFLYIVALGIGYLMPDFWLGHEITKRQTCIRRGLPDVLDLLIICIEAGLGLDQALARSVEELRRSQPAISDELGIVVLEQRAGRPRTDAWRHMAERTDLDVIRNLVTMLVQSEQFGTSIAKTLRIQSDTLRTQRAQQVEELAAKTTVKLIFPLVLFIFPCLFLVMVGPAAILIADSFGKHLGH